MGLIEKIASYYKVIFPSDKAAQHASDALMDFVTTNAATISTMVGPQRVVMWEEETGPFNTTLYLSPGAVRILQGLGVVVPNSQKIAPEDLPKSRVLMLGDASDWNR